MKQMQVPKEWHCKKISDITSSFSGGTPSTKVEAYWKNGEIPWIRSGELEDNEIEKVNTFITKIGLKKSSAKLYPPNTVLVAITGATTGKTALLKIESCGTQNVFGILPCRDLLPRYLWYFMRFSYKKLVAQSIGGAQSHINGAIIKNTEIVFPDLDTQVKIIKKIDFLFSELEQKEKSILELRNKKLKAFKILPNNFFNGIVMRMLSINQTNEWSKVCLDDIAQIGNDKFTDGPFGSRLKVKDYTQAGIRIIRLQNIREGEFFDKGAVYTSEEKYNELIRHAAKAGDILIAKMAYPVARSCILPPVEKRFIVSADCIKLRVNEEKAIPKFVMYTINSPLIRKQAIRKSKGMTRLRINLSDVKKLEFSLPPLQIQKKIVMELDTAKSALNLINERLDKSKKIQDELGLYFNHLYTSILEKAFSGKLVN